MRFVWIHIGEIVFALIGKDLEALLYQILFVGSALVGAYRAYFSCIVLVEKDVNNLGKSENSSKICLKPAIFKARTILYEIENTLTQLNIKLLTS